MTRKPSLRLGAGELELLQMLWREGAVTLSQAQRGLDRPVGYTTVQTRLNRLVEKGAATRSKDRPAHYRAAVAPEEASAGHLELLLKRVSDGSIVPLVAHLMKRQAFECRGDRGPETSGAGKRALGRGTLCPGRRTMNAMAADVLAALVRTTLALAAAGVGVRLLLAIAKPSSPGVHRAAWVLVLAHGWLWYRLGVAIPYEKPLADPVRTEVSSGEPWADPAIAGMPAAMAETMAESLPPRVGADNGPLRAAPIRPPQAEPIRLTWGWQAKVLAAWLVGMAGVVVFWLASYLRFVRCLPPASPAEAEWEEEWERLVAKEAPGAAIGLWVTADRGPALCRLPRGHCLLVPATLWQRLAPAEAPSDSRARIGALSPQRPGEIACGARAGAAALVQPDRLVGSAAVRRGRGMGLRRGGDRPGTAGARTFAHALVELDALLPQHRFQPTAARGRGVSMRILRLLKFQPKEDSAVKRSLVIGVALALAAACLVRVEWVAQGTAAEQRTAGGETSASPSTASPSTTSRTTGSSAGSKVEAANAAATLVRSGGGEFACRPAPKPALRWKDLRAVAI